MSGRKESIRRSLNEIREELAEKANLIAVSKTYPLEDVVLAYQAGQLDFGENKVQELKEKAGALLDICPDIRWHFIGKLQTNKINALLQTPNLVSIHSIDSIKLLNKILSKAPDIKIGLFLQYNTSGELEKSGFETFEELETAANAIKGHKSFYLQGLMTMGSIRADDFEKAAKDCFAKLRELKSELERRTEWRGLQLSMGMSGDYRLALSEGTDWIRVGTKIFGRRSP